METISIIITTKDIGSTIPTGNMSVDLPGRRAVENRQEGRGQEQLGFGAQERGLLLREKIYWAFPNGIKFPEEKV